MGRMVSDEFLLMRWVEMCADPRLRDLGAKFELNGLGVIEMSPADNRHGMRQARLGYELQRALPHGTTITECSVLTADGVRVPDVAWASADFMRQHGDHTPFPQAPELCVEIRSPSNTDAEMAHKVDLYLQAGAQEVWIVDETGSRTVHDATGEIPASRWNVPA